MHALTRNICFLVALLFSAVIQADPPSRVARLSNLEGNVSFLPAGEEQWLDASRNRPFVTGDSLWNDSNGYSQAQLGGAKLCVGPNTNVTLLNLDNKVAQFQLTEGSVNLEVNSLSNDQTYEIDTPNVAFTVQKPGNYRIDVDKEGDATIVQVAQGQAQVFGDSNSYVINNDQAYQFKGTNLDYDPEFKAPPQDDLDKWCQQNKKTLSRSAPRYVSQDIIGYEDLETAGTWETIEEYGPVWTPSNVDEDWAPYRDGHWAWIEPWGWSWVGNESWGFAPYHYGRWVQHHDRWCWVPYTDGPAVYSPALVAFIGGFGSNVGWFPLGPGDIYRPPYSVSFNYFTNINRSNRIDQRLLRDAYDNPAMHFNFANRNVKNGFTAVNKDTFIQSQNVNRARITVNPDSIDKLSATSNIDLKPQKGDNKARASRFKPSDKALSREVIIKAPVPQRDSTAVEPKVHVIKPSKPNDISTDRDFKPSRDIKQDLRRKQNEDYERELRAKERLERQQRLKEQSRQLEREQRRQERIEQKQQEQLQQLQKERELRRQERIQQKQQELLLQREQQRQQERELRRQERIQQKQQEQLQQLQQERELRRQERIQQKQQEQQLQREQQKQLEIMQREQQRQQERELRRQELMQQKQQEQQLQREQQKQQEIMHREQQRQQERELRRQELMQQKQQEQQLQREQQKQQEILQREQQRQQEKLQQLQQERQPPAPPQNLRIQP